MPAMRAISPTTTIISISVTPRVDLAGRSHECERCTQECVRHKRLVSPTDDVRIDPVSARRSVGAQADNVGLISVISGEVIDIRVTPGIVLNLLLQIRPLPVLNALGLLAQR